MADPIADRARDAGIVGAGGAGFPLHVKLSATLDTYLVNGAECEPLLYKDKELMRLQARRLVSGLRMAMEATRATRGIIAVKAKYHDAIDAMEQEISGAITIHQFDNFYPAGDEFVIVYEATGRLIPPGGLPLQVGCAVSNVETLINLSLAAEGVPVTHKALTVTGAVAEPASFFVPVGVSIRDVLAFVGGATVPDPAVIDGGPMMGKAVLDLDLPVTKTTGGYVVLPRDHTLIQRKLRPMDHAVKIARSACDQCMQCTELCPRFLLGYGIEPHKVMRSVGFVGDREIPWAQQGLLCCECSLCDLYTCPEDLTPRDMCVRSKQVYRQKGLKFDLPKGLGRVHPMRQARRVPVDRLIHRLGLTPWNVPAPMTDRRFEAHTVQLLLKQHVGVPAVPVVREGEAVHLGQVVARIPEGKLGVPVHASIDGRVTRIDSASIWITRNDP